MSPLFSSVYLRALRGYLLFRRWRIDKLVGK